MPPQLGRNNENWRRPKYGVVFDALKFKAARKHWVWGEVFLFTVRTFWLTVDWLVADVWVRMSRNSMCIPRLCSTAICLENKGEEHKDLMSQTWPRSPRHYSTRRRRPASLTFFAYSVHMATLVTNKHDSASSKWGRPRRGSSTFHQIPCNPDKVRLKSGETQLKSG